MSSAPPGWTKVRIGDVCSLKNGRAFKPSEWSKGGLPIVRIQNLNNPSAPFNYYDGGFEARHHLKGGELLFAWSGTPGTSFGAHIWQGGEAVLNQHIFRVDFDESAIDKRFLRRAINQKLAELIDIAHGGVGLGHVTKGKFEATEILLASLQEQKRIADRLDRLLAAVDTCKTRLDAIPVILKRFRQSVLAAVTSGELTEEWRRRGARGKGQWSAYPRKRLSELLTEPLRNGRSVRDGEGAKVLRLTSLKGPYIDLSESKRGQWSVGEAEPFFVSAGDFLISRGNGSLRLVGRGALVPDNPIEIAFPDTLIRARPDRNKIAPSYLCAVWSSDAIRRQVEQAARTTAGIWKVSQASLEMIEVPVPPVDEQLEIVRRVDLQLSTADRIAAKVAKACHLVERVTQSILARAFRGELISQEPFRRRLRA